MKNKIMSLIYMTFGWANVPKEERLRLYKAMLEIFENPYSTASGLCSALDAVRGHGHARRLTYKNFPELTYQKPIDMKYYRIYWWEPFKRGPRLKALDKAIALIEDQ